MDNKEGLTTRTILFRNLTGTEARLVDDFAHEMAEKNDLDVEVMTGPSNLEIDKNPIEEVKKHFKRNKDRYMVCGVCFILGGVAALLLTPKRYDKVTLVNPSSVSVSLGDGQEVFGFESFDYRDE